MAASAKRKQREGRVAERLPTVFDLAAERSKRHLHTFFREFAWPVLYPATVFADNWHIGAVCEHLEAVRDKQIKRLLINMPFRMLKSSLVSQAYPAWEWASKPSLEYMTASYAKDLATRDAVNSRRIIESGRYQLAWSDVFQMTSDQNVKTRYENSKRGTRMVASTDAGATGFGGNRLLIDDPVSAMEANSEAARKASIDFYIGTVATRMNNPQEDAIIVTHQRLHEKDLTGHILLEEADNGWCHLVLPMRYERKYFLPTSIGFKDPRKEDGALLHPERVGEDTVKKLENTLGVYHTAAQLQQRPIARGGTVFDSSWFGRYKIIPTIVKRCIFGDTAQKTKEANDYSVLGDFGLGEDGKLYVLDIKRGKWEAHELDRQARDFWNARVAVRPGGCPLNQMKVEDKSSGTGLIQNLRRSPDAIPIVGIPRTRDKLTRFYDGQPFVQAGLVLLPDNAAWAGAYCDEFDQVTKNDTHPHDDQVDVTMDAINEFLSGLRGGANALLEVMREEYTAQKKVEAAAENTKETKLEVKTRVETSPWWKTKL